MGILLHYSLGLYFAAMFGVSGLAKLEQPQEVGKALWRLSRLPLWGLTAIVYLVSGGEIVLATLLVLCIAPVFTASVALIAFVIFLAFKIIAAVVRRGADCGCYGAALWQPVEVSSVATSAILAVAGLIYIWATMHVATVPWSWRCLVGLCFLGSLAFLFLRMRQRSRIDGSLEHREVSGSSRIIESNLQPGDHLPFDPGVCLPRYAFVLFVGRGCPHCATLCEALTDISLGNWALIIVMVDHEDMRMHAMPVDFPIPSSAHLVRDHEGTWAQKSGINATPLALALVDGQLLEQQVGSNVDWFLRMRARYDTAAADASSSRMRTEPASSAGTVVGD